MKAMESSSSAGLTQNALNHPLVLPLPPNAGTFRTGSSAGSTTQVTSRNYHVETDVGANYNRHQQQACGSGIYFDNQEVPMTTALPPPFTVTPANTRKRRRVETPLLIEKAMLPAPALFNAFGKCKTQRCVSPDSLVHMACRAINHNVQVQDRPEALHAPVAAVSRNYLALSSINYDDDINSSVPALPDPTHSEGDAGCKEAALALTSLLCPPSTMPTTSTTEKPHTLTYSLSTNATASASASDDHSCFRWKKPVKPLD